MLDVSRCNHFFWFRTSLVCWTCPDITSFIWFRVGVACWTSPDITRFICLRASLICWTCPDVTSFIWFRVGVACWTCSDITYFIPCRVSAAGWTCPVITSFILVQGRCSVLDVSSSAKERPGGGYVYIYHNKDRPFAWQGGGQTKPSTNIDKC